jgi:hypothetical protein
VSDSLAAFVKKIDTISRDRKIHLDHPEDLIFLDGSIGAKNAITAIVNTVKHPKSVTIKWDGYPALIFGHDRSGKFSIMDKHMFNKQDGSGRQVFSPDDFVAYDNARGVSRDSLHTIIREIWPGLAKATHGGMGYYWGDLLFSHPLRDQDGVFVFKANPNGIVYKVAVDSDVGRLLDGKNAGIVVHQFLSPEAHSTKLAESLNGTIGKLKNNSDVAIVSSKMPVTPKLSTNAALIEGAQNAITEYGNSVDKFFENAPQARNSFTQSFTVYVNKRIVAGDLTNLLDGFMDFIAGRSMTDRMRAKITEYIQNNLQAVKGAFTIWVEIYKLKMDVVSQLNDAAEASPVKGYLQDGTMSHEGFVTNGVKLVDRLGFSRQNLAGR